MLHPRFRRFRPFTRPRLQCLEDRTVPTVQLFIDFGESYGPSGISMTAGELADTFANGGIQGPDFVAPVNKGGFGYAATDKLDLFSLESQITGIIDYNGDGAKDATDYTTLRDDVLELVQRYYEPFNVDVQFASNNNLADIRGAMTANDAGGIASGIRDGYVLCSLMNLSGVGSVGEMEGLFGIAGVDTNWNAPVVTNDLDNVSVVFSDLVIDTAGAPRELATRLAYTIAHEAGHSFGLYHIDSGSYGPEYAQLVGSEIIVGSAPVGGPQRTGLDYFSRFPLPTQGGFSVNDVQNSYALLANFAQSNIGVKSDPTLVGAGLPNPGVLGPTYVTGTGANDVITITRGLSPNTADVTVQPFRTTTFTNPIDIPGVFASTYSYTVNIDGGLLIDGGFGADRFNIDASLGQLVTIRGMAGTDQLVITGNLTNNVVYTPGTNKLPGLDNQSDRRATVVIDGTTTIQLQEFETTSRITGTNLASFTFQSPGGADALTLTNVAGAATVQGKVGGGLDFIPFSISNVSSLIIDAGNNDTAADNDVITLKASPMGVNLVNVQIRTGLGDDKLTNSAAAFALPLGTFTFDGGDGNDIFDDATTGTNIWTVDGAGSGNLDGFGFANIETLKGGSRTDRFVMAGGSLAGGIDGEGGTDSLTDFSSNANTWNITGVNTGNYTSLGSFVNIETITGGGGSDVFVIGPGGSIGGLDGGLGMDTIDDASGAATNWTITGVNAGGYNVLAAFTNIESVQGDSGDDTFTINGGRLDGGIDGEGGTDKIVVLTGDATWTITGVNAGTGTVGGAFKNVEGIQGGSGVDTFQIAAGGSLQTLDGGAGNDVLQDLGNRSNTWSINGPNSGAFNGTQAFLSVETLIGGAGFDLFRVGTGGSLTGSVNGAGGNDTLHDATGTANVWLLTGPNAGSVDSVPSFVGIENVVGGRASDLFRITASAFLSGLLDGEGGTDTILTEGAGAFRWSFTGDGLGSLNRIRLFQDIENAVGGPGSDTFAFALGARMGVVDGGAGDDVLDLRGAARMAVAVTGNATSGGFNLSVSGSAVRNVNRVLANGRPGDLFLGLSRPSQWIVNGATLRYQSGGAELLLSGFDVLRGGASSDRFVVNFQAGVPTGMVFDGGVGADTISVNGTIAADNITVNSTNIVINGRVLGFARFESAEVRGGVGNDTIRVTPSASLRISVFGDSQAGGVGDTLFLSAQNTRIIGRPRSTRQGQFVFSNALALNFAGIERIIGDRSLFSPD